MRLERAVGYGALASSWVLIAYAIGLLAALSLLAAACGNDDDTTVLPSPTAEATVETTTEATPEATATMTASTTAEATVTATSQPTPEPTPESTPLTTPDPTAAPTLEPTPAPTPEPTPTPDAGTTIEVEVAGGKPVGGVERHRVDARESVTITVVGDTTDELHIHGYDLVVPFSPGQPGNITFEANIPGIFEVETHHHGDLVMELQVG